MAGKCFNNTARILRVTVHCKMLNEIKEIKYKMSFKMSKTGGAPLRVYISLNLYSRKVETDVEESSKKG